MPSLLKNAVPLYEVPAAIEAEWVSREGWAEIRRAVLLHNPGLGGCLDLFESGFPPPIALAARHKNLCRRFTNIRET
jgi:hypothetical protein